MYISRANGKTFQQLDNLIKEMKEGGYMNKIEKIISVVIGVLIIAFITTTIVINNKIDTLDNNYRKMWESQIEFDQNILDAVDALQQIK